MTKERGMCMKKKKGISLIVLIVTIIKNNSRNLNVLNYMVQEILKV